MEDLVVEEFEQKASVQTKNTLASNCKKYKGNYHKNSGKKLSKEKKGWSIHKM